MRSDRAEQDGKEGAQEKPQPLEQEGKVVSDSGEDGVDRITLSSGKIVPVHCRIVIRKVATGSDGAPEL